MVDCATCVICSAWILWNEADGTQRSAADLQKKLSTHLEFLNQIDKNLIGEGPKEDESLRLNLDGAKLMGLKLSEPDFMWGSFQGTDLENAVLIKANFISANLYDAFLRRAILDKSNFLDAKMFNTRLMYASLRNVNLKDANLEEADVDYADLKGAVYEPKKHPNTYQIALARNLSYLRYKDNSIPLNELKKRFKDGGFTYQYKEVVAALRRVEGGVMSYILFDVTCEYGSNPLRPLLLIFVIIPIFMIIYVIALKSSTSSGIYLLYTGARVNTGKERMRIIKLYYQYSGFRCFVYSIRSAMVFSILSAFNIGFKEVNVSQWLRLAQPREFDLKAR